jgi:hypothetical protein
MPERKAPRLSELKRALRWTGLPPPRRKRAIPTRIPTSITFGQTLESHEFRRSAAVTASPGQFMFSAKVLNHSASSCGSVPEGAHPQSSRRALSRPIPPSSRLSGTSPPLALAWRAGGSPGICRAARRASAPLRSAWACEAPRGETLRLPPQHALLRASCGSIRRSPSVLEKTIFEMLFIRSATSPVAERQ